MFYFYKFPLKLGVLDTTLYDIKFVSDLRKIGGVFPDTPVSATNKTDSHDIAELLLKVALSAITPITLLLLLQVALRY